jgi:hypothetical protein
LDRIAAEISRHAVPYAWHADDRIIEIAPREVLDARDLVLVSYKISDVIRSVTAYGRPYDNAVADVTSLLHELVEPTAWRENGGSLAQLRVVGGRMFVQAPKRMHTQIEWILEQLRQDVANADDNPLPMPAPDAGSRLRPGDQVTLSIYELFQPNEWTQLTRTIDSDGLLRVPEIGDIRATGLNRRELEEQVIKALSERVMKNPKVQVEFGLATFGSKQAATSAR